MFSSAQPHHFHCTDANKQFQFPMKNQLPISRASHVRGALPSHIKLNPFTLRKTSLQVIEQNNIRADSLWARSQDVLHTPDRFNFMKLLDFSEPARILAKLRFRPEPSPWVGRVAWQRFIDYTSPFLIKLRQGQTWIKWNIQSRRRSIEQCL